MTFDKFSQHDHLVCLDIETVPDRDLIPDWGNKFPPKPIHHRVVAVSAVEAAIRRPPEGAGRYFVRWCRGGGHSGGDEQRLLKRFWESYFPGLNPRVVTWNGKAFDM